MSEIQKFLFEGLPVRGSIVRLDAPWQEMLARRAANTETGPYPECVAQLLGEMSAAALLMQANIQFDGALVLQIQGDGPLRLAVAEVKSNLRLRATAQLAPDAAAALQALPSPDLQALCNAHGQGRCAITLDAEHKQPGYRPYQGIVSLTDAQGQTLPSLAATLEQYMQQSEQLDTVLLLAADQRVAAGLLLQRIPVKGQANLGGALQNTDDEDAQGQNEHFNRIATLARSLTREELLTLDSATILRRLFWQEQLQPLDTAGLAPHFGCQCSRERVAAMLQSLGQAEVQAMQQEQPGQPLEIGCEFCGAQYRFDAVDTAQLFTPLATPGQQDQRH
ncbi:redox-regulated molecular chaperone Hsp33 [Vandammella animalimorsus]|uniref:Redox-regulated molecular chaperone Hsp33 n=1 Tax=Vandammella animalimorsus TaxID=2029117 RepID=A0A2A2T3N3_9BURK|nr:Hsp33 family molecular chaperone HslO [Vandammella animalimorsus]PAT32482.1 redox-regulated molecular chaperone Hsp33 [Vandammella animalimorsus]PAX16038.1 redox-regulated molecular chaperone Hsp33 [Vandammella animalimorsus]PAX20267.1 redox-regulated molecular chaperone Hsp33 [Vandammella animalimorsus]